MQPAPGYCVIFITILLLHRQQQGYISLRLRFELKL